MKNIKVREAQRMFNAALPDRMSMSWDMMPYTANQVIYTQLAILRNRAREQSRNNDYVVRLIGLLQNNVIGSSGFKVRSQAVMSSGKPDLFARSQIEQGWENFCNTSGFIDIQQMIMSSMVTDGEAFVSLSVKKGVLRCELIDPCRIDIEYNIDRDNGNSIVMGIEYDKDGDAVAYWVNDNYEKYHPGIGENAGTHVERTRVPASRMLHIFRKQYVAQRRGLPWIAASLGRLFQLGRFEEAALTAARIGAAKMGFFYNENNDEYTGDESSGDMSLTCEAGTFENIGTMRFQQFDPTYPSGEFRTFVEKILMGISSGWGVDYHSVGNDLGSVNYSSARVGMLETREYYKTLQTWLTNQFIRPVFLAWLELELTAHPRFWKDISYYSPALFVGRRWDWVDPAKEASAQLTQYEMRIKSLSQIIRERGENPIDVFTEIAEENQLLEQLGITASDVIEKVNEKPKSEDKDEEQDKE